MLAADAMLRSSRFDFRVPWIRRPRGGLGERLGLRRRSTRQEPGTVGEKAGSLRWMTSCFMDPASKGKKMEAESVRGGEDLWDAESAAQQGRFPEHLVVMVNGLVGSAEDWKFAAEQLVKKLPDKVIVHRSECNSSRLTFDGVDLMGDRLAEEVRTVVKQRGGVRKISFVAHSLGGLVARYAIGRLYEPVTSVEFSCGTAEESKGKDICMLGRIAGLEPMNFITFASPHLGSRGHRQLPFLCGLPFLEQRASETAHFIVGRTGKHLFLTDKDDGKLPLLVRMVGDCDDIKFRSALRCFKRRVAYANANFDHMVGWRTSSIRRQRELPKHHLLVGDKNYPHIVYVDKGDKINTHNEMPIEAPKDELEEEMIRGLAQVPWERVDVSFQKSRQRYVAHNTIQVKSYWLNSDGADVIFHMIDNFLI
ncbi:putative lipase C4A8.10 isoform X1 [Zingiber officinale]|uniref:putative lipase C4A8.10 isoform X1 n=1 Tax=Zingiber officinale TaxID=94328 RepID=UPI001C4D609C|nr:putative lipase C4A8.10 isoform X1 [Zingiber officinale]